MIELVILLCMYGVPECDEHRYDMPDWATCTRSMKAVAQVPLVHTNIGVVVVQCALTPPPEEAA